MLKQTSVFGAVLVAAMSTQAAFAGADCPKNPKEQWLSELDMQKKIVNDYGYIIDRFKADGDCYEIYGRAPKSVATKTETQASTDPATKETTTTTTKTTETELVKIEVYFNTATGEIVKKEVDD